MKTMSGIAAMLVVVLLLGSSVSLGQDNCAGNHTIQVEPSGDGPPVLSYRDGDAEEVHVCIGDRVQWVLIGSDRQFFVDFFSGAPFEGATRRGSSASVVSVTIGGPAERGRSYEYGVEMQGGPAMDPRIVVD